MTAPKRSASRQAWVDARRAAYEAWSAPVSVSGAVNPSKIWRNLAERYGDKAILTNGAGNFAAWLHRFYQHGAWPGQLAPTSGAMGYGLPAAIAAKLEHPDRPVICAAGDGDFLMAAPELATAVQHQADIVVCVFDNGAYGTIRMHQEMHYPGRISGTGLANPDFKAMAESFGAAGYFASTTQDAISAIDDALGGARPALVHIKQSLADIAPGKTLAV